MLGGRDHIEIGQVLDLELVVADLDERDIQFRLDGYHLAVVVSAVGHVNAQILGVEDVAIDGEDIAVRRDKNAAAVRLQTPETAGSEQFDQFWIYFVAHLSEGILGPCG